MRFIKFIVSAAVLCAAPVESGLFKNKEKEQVSRGALVPSFGLSGGM